MFRLLAVPLVVVFAACTFDAGVGADPPMDEPPQTDMSEPEPEPEEEETKEEETEEEETEEEETEEEETEEEETEEEETEEEETEEEETEEEETEEEVVVVPGNPKCSKFDLTIEESFTGKFVIDDSRTVIVHSEDGIYLDWASDFGIDEVIVKGGPSANVYSYSPAAFEASDLHAPINPVNGEPYALSHVSFCYDGDE